VIQPSIGRGAHIVDERLASFLCGEVRGHVGIVQVDTDDPLPAVAQPLRGRGADS
jgi:hypothetical protein